MKIKQIICSLIILLVMTSAIGCKKTVPSTSISDMNSDSIQSGLNSDIVESGSQSTGSISLSGITSQSASKSVSNSLSKSASVSIASSSQSSSVINPLDGYFVNNFMPLGKDIMPIGAWVSPPPGNYGGLGNPNYITNENYKTIKESGINFIEAIYERADLNINDVLNALDFANANGIKYIVRDNNAISGMDDPEMMNESLDRYKNKPAFLGNMMFDEPATTSMNDLAACYPNYKASLPNSLFYINLLPTYATRNQLFVKNTDGGGGKSSDADYKNYLQTFVDKINPKFLSYDYYPCEGAFPNLTSNYFNCMSMVRAMALKQNIPFWVFIQNCSYGQGVRNPVKQEIDWQVNTALAYGSKGIQYFCYWSPIESTAFSSAMVTKTGEKTQTYYSVQTMNKQITAIDEILMNSTSKGIMVSGNSPVPVPQGDVLTSYKELEQIAGSVPLIAGCFNNAGKSAFYVVNNTINNNGNATMTFSSSQTVQITQKAQTTQKSGKQITINLDAGEGVLVRIQ